MATNMSPRQSSEHRESDSRGEYTPALTVSENMSEKMEAEDSNNNVYVRPLPPDLERDDYDDKDEEPVILERAFSRRSTVNQTQSHQDQPDHTHHPHQFPLTDLDNGIVGWDSQDDPQNPINFPRGRKWALLSLVSAITFVSPLASSMFAPAVGFMGEDFGVREELLLSFTVSVYLLGYVVSLPHCR